MLHKSTNLLGYVLLLAGAAAATAATAPERAVLYRPSDGDPGIWGVSGRPANDPSVWQDSLDQAPFWGWSDISHVALADINGDGLDDKVMVQPIFDQFQVQQPGHQIIVNYTRDNDLSVTGTLDDLTAPNGDNFIDWQFLGTSDLYDPIFGDVDGDGVDDSGITTTGDIAFPANDENPAGDPAWLTWGAWKSQGLPGISRNQGGGADFTGWGVFGVSDTDIPLLGDINGDGVDDRIIYRPTETSNDVFIDFSDPNGGWGDAAVDRQVTIGDVGDKVSISDINGDGLDDLVLIRAFPEWPGSPVSENGTGINRLFGYYTESGGNLDVSAVDIESLWGQLNNDCDDCGGAYLSPDLVLFGQLDLPVASEILGDFNEDGSVDAADYAVWRNNLNSNEALPNDNNLGVPVGTDHYDLWRANYGSGGNTPVASVAAPEPLSVSMGGVFASALLLRRWRRRG